jgi:hypothetical protein
MTASSILWSCEQTAKNVGGSLPLFWGLSSWQGRFVDRIRDINAFTRVSLLLAQVKGVILVVSFWVAAAVSVLFGIFFVDQDILRWLKFGIWHPYRLEDALAGTDVLSWIHHPQDWIGVARIVGEILWIPLAWLLIPLAGALALLADAFRGIADERIESLQRKLAARE